MRTVVLCVLSLTVLLPGFSQTPANAGAGLPKDPKAILAAAAPLYDFSSPGLKPWHLKASYQLYDLKGQPAEQGTWEYWWASPKVHRSSWTRTGSEHSEWSTADGASYRKDSGSPLRYFERTIATTFLFPLPPAAEVNSDRLKLGLKIIAADKSAPPLACVVTETQSIKDGKPRAQSSGGENYYCFDSGTMALLVTYSNQFATQFSGLVKMQGHYLARQVAVTYGKQKSFSASVETIDAVNPADAIFTPAADATLTRQAPDHPRSGEDDVATGELLKKVLPIYPIAAKEMAVQGVVVLGAVIGTDGKVHELEVLASPSPLLNGSAMDSVKQWEYKPYLLNGKPVEVETTINVVFHLGG